MAFTPNFLTDKMIDEARSWAVCAICGKHTAGRWQWVSSGTFERYPQVHKAADGGPCPGNDLAALIAR